MTFLPLRARATAGGDVLLVSDSGRFAAASSAFVDRIWDLDLSEPDRRLLERRGLAVEREDELGMLAHAYALAERISRPQSLDYLILVPTLRCNLSCSYCQVSRVGEGRSGFDWTDETLEAVLAALDGLSTKHVKIEFQGGEPTLRPDLIRAVIERCERFEDRQFVICTNLQELGAEILELFDRDDLYISTSLDGDSATHGRNRTGLEARTIRFLENLEFVIDRYGPSKVSALPTIDPRNPPDIDALIDAYARHGLRSIFLRPINYQGFARKRHGDSREQDEGWRTYHRAFVRRLIERNWEDRSQILEETYLGICLRRIFRPGHERHVDLRNPNPMGLDYIVIDHDGTVYPTDEARMLARSGVVDLSIGHVSAGWAGEKRDLLNREATNQFDAACSRCVYQPFCGRDLVDDLARYGRIDLPRTETDFCRKHLGIFDFLFELIYSDEPAVRYSLSRWLRLPGTPEILGARLE